MRGVSKAWRDAWGECAEIRMGLEGRRARKEVNNKTLNLRVKFGSEIFFLEELRKNGLDRDSNGEK